MRLQNLFKSIKTSSSHSHTYFFSHKQTHIKILNNRHGDLSSAFFAVEIYIINFSQHLTRCHLFPVFRPVSRVTLQNYTGWKWISYVTDLTYQFSPAKHQNQLCLGKKWNWNPYFFWTVSAIQILLLFIYILLLLPKMTVLEKNHIYI